MSPLDLNNNTGQFQKEHLHTFEECLDENDFVTALKVISNSSNELELYTDLIERLIELDEVEEIRKLHQSTDKQSSLLFDVATKYFQYRNFGRIFEIYEWIDNEGWRIALVTRLMANTTTNQEKESIIERILISHGRNNSVMDGVHIVKKVMAAIPENSLFNTAIWLLNNKKMSGCRLIYNILTTRKKEFAEIANFRVLNIGQALPIKT